MEDRRSAESDLANLVRGKSSHIVSYSTFIYTEAVTKVLAVVALLLLGQNGLTTEVLFFKAIGKVNVRKMSSNNGHRVSCVFISTKSLYEFSKRFG